MAGRGKHKHTESQVEPAVKVVLEHESGEDAEDRLLMVYEFLLGLREGLETTQKGRN